MFSKDGRLYSRRLGLGLLLVVLLTLATFQAAKPTTDPILTGPGPLAPAGRPVGIRHSGALVGGADQPQSLPGVNGVRVGTSSKNGVSRPLRDIQPLITKHQASPREEDRNEKIPIFGHKDVADPVIQRMHDAPKASTAAGPAVVANFAGIDNGGSGCGCAPPDTDGAVGPTQYLQMVNDAFQVFSKTGDSLYGPTNINSLWNGFGGQCENTNDGDPVVLYDALADRWLVSQFTASAPYTECIAVSQTPDATGMWNLYAFELSTADFPDYPKLGVWPDGYYMSVNQFTGGILYGGPAPYVFDRVKMLTGQPATFQTFPALGRHANPLMPADLNGPILPPSGAPNYFVEFGDNVGIYKFHVDWNTPANSSFTNSANLPVAGFTELCPTTRDCVPQPGTDQQVDGLGDRFMFRLAYRNFRDHEAMVINHAVDVGGGHAGVRWYEIRNPSTAPAIYQQGTFAPDGDNRWAASAAMDQAGNIAVGYSVSSSTTYPSIRYASRAASDPLGTLANETSLMVGSGSQTTPYRWGDYSAMTVDPADDCTFWYTQEYYAASADYGWSTQIGSFKFPNCGVVYPPRVYMPVVGDAKQ